MIEELRSDIKDIEQQLRNPRRDDADWEERARYALSKKKRKLSKLESQLRNKAHNTAPSQFLLEVYENCVIPDQELAEAVRLFLTDKCGYTLED